jgi:hypothetical protein
MPCWIIKVALPPSAFESWFLNNALSQSDLDDTLHAAREAVSGLSNFVRRRGDERFISRKIIQSKIKYLKNQSYCFLC